MEGGNRGGPEGTHKVPINNTTACYGEFVRVIREARAIIESWSGGFLFGQNVFHAKA